MITGDNGVVDKASNASVINREAKAKEEILMAWTGVNGEYNTEWTENTNLDKVEYFSDEEGRTRLNKYLADTGIITNGPTYSEGQYTLTYKTNDTGMEYVFLIDESNNVIKKSGISIEPQSVKIGINEKVQLEATLDGIEENIIWTSENTNIAIVDEDGLVTGVSKGEVVIKAICGDESKDCNVKVTEVYTVKLYRNSSTIEVFKTLKVLEGEKANKAIGYTEPEAPTVEMKFAKWKLKKAITGYAVDEDATELLNGINGVMQDLEVYATFEDKPEFGEVDVELKSYLGRTVLTSSEISYGTSGWQLFYADSDKIYLIYADYLENGKIPTANNILKSGYRVYVSTSTNRDVLIDYLKTESNWTSVSSVFNTKYGVSGIKAKGSPMTEMWIASFNSIYGTNFEAKNFKTNGQLYYTSLWETTGELTDSTGTTEYNGYLFTRDNRANPIKYEKFLPYQVMEASGGYPGKNKAGNMYYPHTERVTAESTEVYGYYLIDPSAVLLDRLTSVEDSGRLYGNSCARSSCAIRPVVSIPRSEVNLIVTGEGTEAVLNLNKVIHE